MINGIILASASLGRKSILQKFGFNILKVIPPKINEDIQKKEDPTAYIKRLAKEKALAVYNSGERGAFIVSADTIIVKGSRIFGKPKDVEEAKKFIKTLSGGRHKVLTAFCVIKAEETPKCVVKVIKTTVLVKNISIEELNWYINSQEWQNKSGSYAIQGLFELFIKQINGSVSNVVGLPIMNVYNTLLGLGYKFDYQKKD